MHVSRLLATACASAALLLRPGLAASPNDYRGPNGGDWNAAYNWSAGAVPNGSVSYDVTNSSANTVLHASSTGSGAVDSVNSLSFTGAGGLTVSGGSLSSGAASFSGGGALTVSGGSLSAAGLTFSGTSGAAVSSGTLTAGSLSSTGTGTVLLSGGTLAGAQANQASVLSVAGTLQLGGGTLQNWTVQNSDAVQFTSNRTTVLSNVSLSGGLALTWRLDSGGTARIQGTFSHPAGAMFNLGTYGAMDFDGVQTLDNATVNFGGGTAQLNVTSGTLTLGSGLTLQGGQGIFGPFTGLGTSLVNNTTIAASGSSRNTGPNTVSIQTAQFTNNGTVKAIGGASLRVGSDTFTNAGTIMVDTSSQITAPSFTQTGGQATVDGVMVGSGTLTLQGGTLNGSGSITGSVNNSGGLLHPGDSPGTLRLSDDYTQGGGGTFLEQLGGTGAGQFGVLSVGNAATLGGTLDVSLVNGFTPTAGQSFSFLTAGSRTGTFATVQSLDASYSYSVDYTNSSVILTVTSVAPTPEPSAWVVLAAGLLGLGGLRLRTRAAGQAG